MAEAKKVLIMNHGARGVNLGVAMVFEDDAGVRTTEQREIRLIPGLNQVDAETYEALEEGMEEGKLVAAAALFDPEQTKGANGEKMHLEFKGALKGEGRKVDTDATGKAKIEPDVTLAEYTVEESKEMIVDTLDRDQLKAYQLGEKAVAGRKGVLDALEAQLQKLELTDDEKKTKS